MKTIVKKIVVLEDCEKDTLLNAIHILDELSKKVPRDESWFADFASELEDIVYRDGWEVDCYD